MKEQTKQKLKTAGKCTAYALIGALAGIGLACLCTLGVRGCSEAQSTSDQPSTSSKMVRAKRGGGSELRNAQETAWDRPEERSDEPLGATILPDYAPVLTPENNLLDAEGTETWDTMLMQVQDTTSVKFTKYAQANYLRLWLVPVEAGSIYYVSYETGNAGYWLYVSTLSQDGASVVVDLAELGDVGTYVQVTSPNVDWTYSTRDQNARFYVPIRNGMTHLAVFADPRQNPVVKLADTMRVPEKARYTLPNNWNPYQWFGGEPSAVATGTFTWPYSVADLNHFDALVFRSNGRVYNRVWFNLHNMAGGQFVGYWDATNKLQYTEIDEEKQYFIEEINYSFHDYVKDVDVYSDLVSTTRVVRNANVGEGLHADVWLLNEDKVWTSANFKALEVIDYAEDWSPNVNARPQNGLEWLEATFADETRFNPATWTYGNDGGGVFVLIGNAVASVTSFLSVEIFPAISIGLLLVLPLIGGIIVLIIKAVSK